MKKNKPTDEPKIICIWCNAPWTFNMQVEDIYTTGGCDSCGFGSETTGKIEITCDNCGKVVYIKEFKKG
jgi:hypothetical protein